MFYSNSSCTCTAGQNSGRICLSLGARIGIQPMNLSEEQSTSESKARLHLITSLASSYHTHSSPHICLVKSKQIKIFVWFYSIFYFRDYVNNTLRDASSKEVLGIAILALVLLIAPIIIILVRNAVATIQVPTIQFLLAIMSNYLLRHLLSDTV